MEKNPFEIKFHNVFVNLIENLLKVYRRDNDLKDKIKSYYLQYKTEDRFNYIHHTVETLEPYIEAVRQQDESIFCSGDAVNLLPNFDFKLLWGNASLENSQKRVIWGYLTNLYVLGGHYIQKSDSYFQEMLESLKFHQMLEKQANKEIADEAAKSAESERLGQELNKLFKSLFKEDSFVYEIFNIPEVQEIIQGFKQNPLEIIKKFTVDKGRGIAEMAENIANKLKEKIRSGELDRSKIDRDVEKMTRIMSRLKRDLPKDPRFKKIFDMIRDNFNLDITETLDDPEKAVQQFKEKFHESTGVDLTDLNSSNPTKLEELLKSHAAVAATSAETTATANNDDQTFGDLLAAVNEIICSESHPVTTSACDVDGDGDNKMMK